MARVHAVIVHYRSGGMIGRLLDDLVGQEGVTVELHVVECGEDGSLDPSSLPLGTQLLIPGENLGYSGGNNLVLRSLIEQPDPIAIVNPDVEFPSRGVLSQLVDMLRSNAGYAAIAPTIVTPDGLTEYTGSLVDKRRGLAIHTGTYVSQWPSETPELVEMPWIDGACVLFRPAALADVGFFDDRFFLYSEEVDWCLRAIHRGWKVGVARDLYVQHRRSSSFKSTNKGAYYAHRNSYQLFWKHYGPGVWILHWLRRLISFSRSPESRQSGESAAALRGGRDALLGRSGRMAGDR